MDENNLGVGIPYVLYHMFDGNDNDKNVDFGHSTVDWMSLTTASTTWQGKVMISWS